VPATVEWMARGAPFTHEEILALFESRSLLLRDNPYALGVPLNTLRALRSDWRMFLRFCGINGYPPLPSSPAVVTRFIEEAYGSAVNRSVATVERAYLDHLNDDRLGKKEVHKHLANSDHDLQRWIEQYGIEPASHS
jgi:hypothetical protein